MPSKYDFGTIKVGRSRVYDIDAAHSIRQAAYNYCQRHPQVHLTVRVRILASGARVLRVYRKR